MLKFKGKAIKGTHGALIFPSPELRVRRVGYWQVRGEGEIVGHQGGRTIFCRILIHDGYEKVSELAKAIGELDKLIGEHGTLEESGTLEQTLRNVTFEGYEPLPLDGREEPTPLKDIGVLIRDIHADPEDQELDRGWFGLLLLRFRQLRT